MVTDGTGLTLNVFGVPVGWLVLNLRELNMPGSPGAITVRADSILTIRKSGGACILNEHGLRPILVHENFEEVLRRIAESDKPEVKEPVTVPATQPANGISDGTVPVRKKVKA